MSNSKDSTQSMVEFGFALFSLFGGIVVALTSFIYLPILVVVFGAFGGWIVQTLPTGNWVILGTNALGLHIAREQIWQVAAALSWMGSYLKYSPNAQKAITKYQEKVS